jgi:hypothetical protein
MKRMASAAIAVGLAAGTLAAGPASAAEPSAAEVVAKNVAARGGLDAWRKVETMVWIGHIESTHTPVPSLQFKLEQKRPNKTRLEINAPGGKSERVFDGVRGWKVHPGGRSGPQPYSLQELRFAQAGHGIDGPLIDHAARGNSVTLQGVDEIGGRKAYHLSVHLARGGSEDVWVDATTYLDVRHDRMVYGPAGAPRRISATYGDYRTVDGLQIPFLIETGGGPGTTPDKMRIETAVLNAPLDDRTFANAAASHAPLNRMRSLAHRGRAPAAAPMTATTPSAASDEKGATPQ